MLLSRFPRVRLGHLPTPLEPLENLTRTLGGPQLWIKRDDCTGLATGGNKTRKLEFLVGDALAQSADTLVTQGAVQSNHARQTAAAAARHGLKCHILLERRVPDTEQAYDRSGNVLLDKLFGATLEYHDPGLDMNTEAELVCERLHSKGAKPYCIPGGGSSPVGALGYVNCALEIVNQANERSVKFDRIMVGTGSTGTQSGLVAGIEGSNAQIPILGICVRQPAAPQEAAVHQLVVRVAEKLGLQASIPKERVKANGDYVGAGYGIPSEGTLEAISMLAREEGILLDPVYSGKAMAGLIDLIRKGKFTKDETILFLHTGGSAALFAYEETMASILR